MPLFDNIEKLITEHGSAQILRERLGLAADKYDALERKAIEMEAANGELRRELQTSQAEVARLSKLVEPKDGKLTEDEEKALKAFAELNSWVPTQAIASHMMISEIKATYLVRCLLDKRYIMPPHIVLSDSPI
jgi:seryl-tRNA synthetase